MDELHIKVVAYRGIRGIQRDIGILRIHFYGDGGISNVQLDVLCVSGIYANVNSGNGRGLKAWNLYGELISWPRQQLWKRVGSARIGVGFVASVGLGVDQHNIGAYYNCAAGVSDQSAQGRNILCYRANRKSHEQAES